MHDAHLIIQLEASFGLPRKNKPFFFKGAVEFMQFRIDFYLYSTYGPTCLSSHGINPNVSTARITFLQMYSFSSPWISSFVGCS